MRVYSTVVNLSPHTEPGKRRTKARWGRPPRSSPPPPPPPFLIFRVFSPFSPLLKEPLWRRKVVNDSILEVPQGTLTYPRGITFSSVHLNSKASLVGRKSLRRIKPDVSCHLGFSQSPINNPVSIGRSCDIFLLKQFLAVTFFSVLRSRRRPAIILYVFI